jgi:hypothetical protein
MQKAEAAHPKERRSWQLLALERNGRFDHFYGSALQVRMCGSAPMALVRLTIDKDGPYWGWYHSFHPANGSYLGQISMIYSHRVGVEICFAYGPDAETARGRGEIVRLRVERIREAVDGEHIKDDPHVGLAVFSYPTGPLDDDDREP